MGPFPTSKGPEGDKLQGTILHIFFVSILVLIIQSLTKIIRAVFAQIEKSAISSQICPF